MRLNANALPLVAEMVSRAAQLGIVWHSTPSGTRIGDCGVKAAGGLEAGILLARTTMADLGGVAVEQPGRQDAAFTSLWPDCPWPVVAVDSAAPLEACLAAQYAGWKVAADGFFAMASGPLRAAIGREPLFDVIGMRETATDAVGVLETGRLPPDAVCRELAADSGVPPERLVLLVARTASLAGTLQVVARSLETALHKLHDLRFDLTRIQSGCGRAPLPPAGGSDDLAAIGHTNDAILYGGHVVLHVRGDDASLRDVGPRMVSAASADYGAPFATLFERAGRDFYALDPALFAPALVELVNVDTGQRHRYGRLAPALVQESFASAGTAAAGTRR